ncbi:hypothetical protein [Rubrolithibacter danxiaensis]|uniref:hypothetical protein n=1 Tax=Rubrolithibacter danxiaensis TaxID=3390805 RepID=UPI003BF7775F
MVTSSETEHTSGVYFDHHQPSKEQQAYDPDARKKLHALSLKLTALAQLKTVHSN